MNIIEELEAVLEEEQSLLLKGDFVGLKPLVEKKSELAQRLTELKPDVSEATYQELADKAGYNEALLNSARNGLQSAMNRIRHAAESTEQKTYSSSGERQSLARRPASVVQKA